MTLRGRSTLSVSLMDAPVDGVTAVYVKITSMWIKSAGGPAVELPLATAPLTVNLMALTDTNAAILINEAVIEPGTYEWLAMDIAAERGPRDSYVLTEAGGEEEIELRVPSGRVRLVSGFEVPPNQAVRLLFDWDMRQGLVNPARPTAVLLEARLQDARRDRLRQCCKARSPQRRSARASIPRSTIAPRTTT